MTDKTLELAKEKCQRCQVNDADWLHSCPYKQDVNNNDDECNCCGECTRECRLSI